jgi:hypothetical protein
MYDYHVPIVANTADNLLHVYMNGAWLALRPGGATGVWSPLTNGSTGSPELIFAGGDVIMVGG